MKCWICWPIIYVTKYVLGVDLIVNILPSILVILCIMIFGITMGMVISVMLKMKVTGKTGIGLGIILILNYTSGMLGSDFTNMLNKSVPLVNKLNPTAYLQNALTATNMIGDNSYILPAVVYSLSLSAIFFGITVFRLRRLKYNDF